MWKESEIFQVDYTMLFLILALLFSAHNIRLKTTKVYNSKH